MLRALAITVMASLIVVFSTFTFLFIRKVWFGGGSNQPHVAVMNITGVLISASGTVREIERLKKNPSVRAIVVRVNSPGGLVAPSQEIYESLREADKKVPVLISMGSLAASGGYYISLGGRKIFASPGTITASIGVIAEFVNTEKLYKWAKMDRFTLKAGKFKDAGSPFREMKPDERQLLTTMLEDVHVQFKTAVKERRKLTEEEVGETCDGRIMSGSQAKAAKLIDEFGGLEDALREARKLAKLPEDSDVHYPHTRDGYLKRLLFGDQPDEEMESRAYTSVARLFNVGSQLFEPSTPGWRIALLAPIAW